MNSKQNGNAGRGRGVLALSSYETSPRPGATTVGSWHQIRHHRPNYNPAIRKGRQTNASVKCTNMVNEQNGHSDTSSYQTNNNNMKNQDIRKNMSSLKNQEINRQISQPQNSTKANQPAIVQEGDLLAKYTYKSNPDRPGGFDEVSIRQGEKLKLIRKGHEETRNPLWWEVQNECGEIGFVPGNYCMVLEQAPTNLPWLENKRLLEEQEQKKMQSLAGSNNSEDKEYLEIFGTPINSEPVVKQYHSAYSTNDSTPAPKNKAEASKEYYCELCDKNLNGPQPYKMHMSSKAHREEVEYQQSKQN